MSGTRPTALPEPFAYPREPHGRRHGPAGYEDYGHYKPWLRDEFTFRCVYCLERETWYPNRAASFSADHFVPVVLDPTESGTTATWSMPARAAIPSSKP